MIDNSAGDNSDKLTENDLAGFGDPTNHFGPAAGAAPAPTTVDEPVREPMDVPGVSYPATGYKGTKVIFVPQPEFPGAAPLHAVPAGEFDEQAYRVGYEHGQADNQKVHEKALKLAESLAELKAPLIYGKMIEVNRRVTAVGKTSFNEQQRYNFRGIDAVVDALHPVMAEVGVFVVPEVLDSSYRDAMTTGGKPTREVTVKVKYTFYAEDGSSISAVVSGESLDQSDKGTAKAFSVALRIALLQTFTLPTTEPDPDASYHTRDGNREMGEAVKAYVLGAVPLADIPSLDKLWAIVLEHSAAERQIGQAEITWADYFGQRIAEMIDAIEQPQVGRDMWTALKVSAVQRISFQDVPPAKRLNQRAEHLAKRSQEAHDAFMQQILNTTDQQELLTVVEAIQEAWETYQLLPEAKAELNQVASDRERKLDRESNVAGPRADQEDAEDAQQAAAQ